MPTAPHRNIRSVSVAPRVITVGDGLINRLLRHPQVETKIPELAFAVRSLRQAEKTKSKGCSSCGKARRIRRCLESAKSTISNMTPQRLQVLKQVLGVASQGKMKIFIRKGTRIVPITV